MHSPTPKVYVRVAKPDEYGRIAALARKAFIHDPLFNYIGSQKQLLSNDTENDQTRNVETFFLFLLRSCHYVGGRITVAVRKEPGTTKEEIVCAASWCPPNKRLSLSLWKILTLLRGGVLSVIRTWGFITLKRMGEYGDPSHAAQEESYRVKGLKNSPNSAWYLQLIFTDPAYQGQGFMSALMREGYNNASAGIPFILEATTTDSRDRYIHLGYEVVKEYVMGNGRANVNGVAASDQEAVGFPIWTMINWNPEDED